MYYSALRRETNKVLPNFFFSYKSNDFKVSIIIFTKKNEPKFHSCIYFIDYAFNSQCRSNSTSQKNYYRSEEHTSELQSQSNLVCRLLLEKKTTTLVNRLHCTIN